eukprot:CAMPEP_0181188364 /NCGR_PEP_ID=MMETSP1096-20121128/11071_1 /TAXON_ID=156174 ORGANISM="Chrysochromulina ericina, Strain CCMP281" /NCGR_SAMPLE_ID=MMETSP1096 /ASSEMBLY_ACC=CAM_ASM_000453 /LENGTH=168 /DNA_ID=CAMNT_0023277409 /DNA_START=271 /DNA_END=774 /DNA_ORIENTATION=-
MHERPWQLSLHAANLGLRPHHQVSSLIWCPATANQMKMCVEALPSLACAEILHGALGDSHKSILAQCCGGKPLQPAVLAQEQEQIELDVLWVQNIFCHIRSSTGNLPSSLPKKKVCLPVWLRCIQYQHVLVWLNQRMPILTIAHANAWCIGPEHESATEQNILEAHAP